MATGDILRHKLHDEELAATGIFDIQNISQDYDHLIIKAMFRSSVSDVTDNIRMFFNNDTTLANYNSQQENSVNGATLNATGSAADNVPFLGAGDTAPANNFSICVAEILWYSRTDLWKYSYAECGTYRASNDIHQSIRMIEWKDLSAIDRITIYPDGYATDELLAGSRITIHGIKTEA